MECSAMQGVGTREDLLLVLRELDAVREILENFEGYGGDPAGLLATGERMYFLVSDAQDRLRLVLGIP